MLAALITAYKEMIKILQLVDVINMGDGTIGNCTLFQSKLIHFQERQFSFRNDSFLNFKFASLVDWHAFNV